MSDYVQYPRTLDAALERAIIHLRALETSYRYQRKGDMDKNVRRQLAAEYAEYSRILEEHKASLAAKAVLGEVM